MENGQINLEKLSKTSYNGLPPSVKVFQIINVMGRSNRELGFWSEGIGFFYDIEEIHVTYSPVAIIQTKKNGSMQYVFGQIFCPGGSPSIPRGWEIPTLTNRLRIGVPNSTMINSFAKVTHDPSSNSYSFSGFSIEVFKRTVEQLPYYLLYDFFPYDGIPMILWWSKCI